MLGIRANPFLHDGSIIEESEIAKV
jgi:hypothetical protein